GVVAFADTAAQVVLVHPGECVPVQGYAEAGAGRYRHRTVHKGQWRFEHVHAELPRRVRVGRVRQVRRRRAEMRHRGEADTEVAVGVHGQAHVVRLADPGEALR